MLKTKILDGNLTPAPHQSQQHTLCWVVALHCAWSTKKHQRMWTPNDHSETVLWYDRIIECIRRSAACLLIWFLKWVKLGLIAHSFIITLSSNLVQKSPQAANFYEIFRDVKVWNESHPTTVRKYEQLFPQGHCWKYQRPLLGCSVKHGSQLKNDNQSQLT